MSFMAMPASATAAWESGDGSFLLQRQPAEAACHVLPATTTGLHLPHGAWQQDQDAERQEDVVDDQREKEGHRDKKKAASW
jgi:hypothetical protein